MALDRQHFPTRPGRTGTARRRLTRALLAALLALALGAAPVAAHSVVRISGSTLSYHSVDAISLNQLTISQPRPDTYKISDPAVQGGIDPGPCMPISESEVDCPASRVSALDVDLGERDDTATLRVSIPTRVLGGPGNDAVSGGEGNDTMSGEDGDDRLDGAGGNDVLAGFAGSDSLNGDAGEDLLHGGGGGDALSGGDGNDTVRSREGVADQVVCGAGVDRVTVDPADSLPESPQACESIDRAAATEGGDPPPPGTEAPPDRTPPVLTVGGSTVQRLPRRGRIVILAATSEPGAIVASGVARIGRARHRLRPVTRRVTLAGGGVRLTVALPRRALAPARRAVARGRRVAVVVRVIARDAAGNVTPIGVQRSIRLQR